MSIVPVEGVVVEAHLGVEREHVALRGGHERVDLHHRRVGLHEGLVDRQHQLDRLGHQRRVEADAEGQLPGLERLQAHGGIDVRLPDEVGRLVGHLLDLDAALGAGHHHRAAGRAVDDDAQVELPGHLQALLDEDALDDAAVGAGLVGDQRHAEHVLGVALGLLGRPGDLDAAALAASARVNLRLDDDDAAAEPAGHLARLEPESWRLRPAARRRRAARGSAWPGIRGFSLWVSVRERAGNRRQPAGTSLGEGPSAHARDSPRRPDRSRRRHAASRHGLRRTTADVGGAPVAPRPRLAASSLVW